MVKKFAKFIPLLAAILIVVAISFFRLLDKYELATLDLRYILRPPQPVNPDIVLVEVADDSIEKIGRWPFDRDWHATLLNILARYGARMVFFDFIFSEKDAGDDALIKASQKIDVYYASAFDLTRGPGRVPVALRRVAPILEGFKEFAKGIGYINVPPDIDGKLRRVPLLIEYEGDSHPTASPLLARDYLGLSMKDLKIPADENSSMIVNYPARWKDSFRHFSYIDIIMSHYEESRGGTGTVNLRDLKGKVCFVGLTATGTHDVKAVPLETVYPGVGVQASAFNTITTGHFITRASRSANLGIIFLLALATAVASARFRPFKSLCAVSAAAFGLIAAAFLLFIFLRVWIDIFFPVVLMALVYLYLTVYKFSAERRKRELMEKELSVAKSIQESFLPEAIPEIQGVEIEASMLTARHVGGDLYDFVDYGGGMLGVMIGDVSGKGVPAALFMAQVVSEFRIFSKDNKGPSATLKKLNDQVVSTSKTNLFVTMSYLLLDARKKTLTFASGGHPPVLLARGREVRRLDAKEGMALGLFESDFSEDKTELREGDLLVLYTDGVTEAMNGKGEEFGVERLSDLIKRPVHPQDGTLLKAIYKEIERFVGKTPQHDDITVIVIRIS